MRRSGAACKRLEAISRFCVFRLHVDRSVNHKLLASGTKGEYRTFMEQICGLSGAVLMENLENQSLIDTAGLSLIIVIVALAHVFAFALG